MIKLFFAQNTAEQPAQGPIRAAFDKVWMLPPPPPPPPILLCHRILHLIQ